MCTQCCRLKWTDPCPGFGFSYSSSAHTETCSSGRWRRRYWRGARSHVAAPFVIWHDACVTFDLIQLMDANCLYVFAIRRRKSRLPGISSWESFKLRSDGCRWSSSSSRSNRTLLRVLCKYHQSIENCSSYNICEALNH